MGTVVHNLCTNDGGLETMPGAHGVRPAHCALGWRIAALLEEQHSTIGYASAYCAGSSTFAAAGLDSAISASRGLR